MVLGEENHRTLLVHRVSHEDIYHRQGEVARRRRGGASLGERARARSRPLSNSPAQKNPPPKTTTDDTIITWTDADLATDVALSFQEAAGCDAIWEQMAAVQREARARGGGGGSGCGSGGGGFGGRGARGADDPDADDDDADLERLAGVGGLLVHGGFLTGRGSLGGGGMGDPLPPPEMGNLEAIGSALASIGPFQRERAAQQLLSHGYLSSLLDLFRVRSRGLSRFWAARPLAAF